MFYCLSAMALIFLVLGAAAIRRCAIYSPLVISASVWLMVFIAGLVFQERFYPLKEKAFIAWTMWFLVTSLVFFLLYPSRVESAWTETEIRRIPVDYAIPLLLLIAWLGYRIWVVGSSGPEHFFFNLRLSAIYQDGFANLGLVTRFYPLTLALFLFEHVYARRDNRHLRLLLWFAMLLYAVATMSKLAMVTPLLSWAVIQGISGKMRIKTIIILASVALALMMAVHFIRTCGYDKGTVADVLAIYIYSPLVALGYMDIDRSLPFGAYVFRFIYAIAYHLNMGAQPVSIITPYVAVPELTNTYTVMQPFYHDFGLRGVILEAVLYGLIFSGLYSLSVKGSRLGLVLYSSYSIVLAGQFIGDFLISFFSGNLQFLIYALAVFLFSRKVYYPS
jgi:oligosaccharide repeat unit polymerase